MWLLRWCSSEAAFLHIPSAGLPSSGWAGEQQGLLLGCLWGFVLTHTAGCGWSSSSQGVDVRSGVQMLRFSHLKKGWLSHCRSFAIFKIIDRTCYQP